MDSFISLIQELLSKQLHQFEVAEASENSAGVLRFDNTAMASVSHDGAHSSYIPLIRGRMSDRIRARVVM
jgi:hypothetical protein